MQSTPAGYYQNTGEGMPHYVEQLKAFRARNRCTYGTHIFPHDIRVKECGSSRTRIEQFVDGDLDARIDARVAPTRSTPHVRRYQFAGSTTLRAAKASRRCAPIAKTGTMSVASGATRLATTPPRVELMPSRY